LVFLWHFALAETTTICNLILPVPDTDFREFLDEVDELARFAPEIVAWLSRVIDK